MASTVTVRGADECILALKNFEHEVTDGRKPFRAFYSAWSTIRRLQWNRVKATGGTLAGKVWKGMSPQYTRKDGTVVPAWGGVPRVSGKGSVLGKLRPSHTRVKQDSVMMRDTGHMANAVLGSPELVEARRMIVSTKDINYAEAQDDRRPFMFWELPHDEQLLTKAFQAHHDAAVTKFNQGGKG